MTTYYHGTDHLIPVLKVGRYVTRHYKDAEKFGYRRAVVNGSGTVFIYTVDVLPEQTQPDPRRDRAFITTVERPVRLMAEVPTFLVANKLARFTRKEKRQ